MAVQVTFTVPAEQFNAAVAQLREVKGAEVTDVTIGDEQDAGAEDAA